MTPELVWHSVAWNWHSLAQCVWYWGSVAWRGVALHGPAAYRAVAAVAARAHEPLHVVGREEVAAGAGAG